MADRTQPVLFIPTLRLAYALIALGVFAADQLSKLLVQSAMLLHESRQIIPGFLNLVYEKNSGIAFSLFAESTSSVKTFLLVFFSSLALAGIAWMLWRTDPTEHVASTGLSLILGGAVGNLSDRVLYGSVVDFLDFFAGPYHWPAFNLADSAIVVGGCLVLLHLAWGEKR